MLRDEVVAERKIVYLRNVGQGSSGLEGEACRTLASYVFAETLRDGTVVTVRAAGANDGPKIQTPPLIVAVGGHHHHGQIGGKPLL